MPQAAPRVQKPNASELFTDRLDQRELLSRVLAPVATGDLGPEFTITVLYGVGGVGKTRLCEHGLEVAAKTFGDQVICAYANFDAQGWHPETSFSLVAAELCRALHRAGVAPRLSTALLTLQQVAPVGGGDERWGLVLDGLDKGVEMSGIPGLSLLVKAGLAARDRVQQTKLRQRLQDLGLWPVETAGQINLMDLQEKLAHALHHDVVDFLMANPESHVRLFIDGFERLQSHANQRDTQWHLQAFVGYFATSAGDAAGRFRALLFGREKLRWDELYQDPTWPQFWNQHLLGGLAQADALDFLRKCQTWHRSRGQSTLADALARHEAAMLDASDEQVQGQQVYYPFFLNLAIDLVERAAASGTVPDLGRAPVELQERFLRYLDQKEKRALQILALAETFDEALFDWLAGERLIGYERSTFHSQLRQERSYFQAVEGRAGEWKLHRKMEDALHALWHSTPAEQHEGRAIVLRLLDYYAAPLRAKEERDWGDAEVEAWRRGMEIIITQGPEGGKIPLLEAEEWEKLLKASPWSSAHFRITAHRLDFTRRLLGVLTATAGSSALRTLHCEQNLAKLEEKSGNYAEAERLQRNSLDGFEAILGAEHLDTARAKHWLGQFTYRLGRFAEARILIQSAMATRDRFLGPEHQDTLSSLGNLAGVHFKMRELVQAETCYRRILTAREKTRASGDREILTALHNLAFVLLARGEFVEAEKHYRQVVAGREKVLGPEHPYTLTSMDNLGQTLFRKGVFTEAETCCRRVLNHRVRILGHQHPDTLRSLNNLAGIAKAMGEKALSETLYRQAFVGLRNALGYEHPDTLSCLLNLGILLQAVPGGAAEADVIFEHVTKLCSKSELLALQLRYRLACLASQRGDLMVAEHLIREEVSSQSSTKAFALADPDLAPIAAFISQL